MEYRYPSYYKDFQCVGGACPATCCAGWEIVIDEQSLKKYSRFPGGFGNRLRNSIDFKRKSFKQYGKRCAFLNEENLCDIYTEAGPKALCTTCRRYPRHIEEFENLREISLSLSCPEAAGILLSQERLVLKEMEREQKTEDYGDFDDLLFSQLLDAREVLFRVMQEGKGTADQNMMLALSLGYHLQEKLDAGQIFGLEALYETYLEPDAAARYHWIPKEAVDGYESRKAMFETLDQLEVLAEDWTEYRRQVDKLLFHGGKQTYEKLAAWKLEDRIKEQLFCYFIYTYFAGAVYDGYPYAKVKLAVFSTLVIEDLVRARRAEQGAVAMEDIRTCAYRYAREVEHSDLNLRKLDGLFRKDPVFSTERMMKSICSFAENMEAVRDL